MVQITIEIPEQIAKDAHTEAARTKRRVEDVLQEWLQHYAEQMPVESLSDERILELTEMQMPDAQQEELSTLLTQNREQQLTARQIKRLDELMLIYRQGTLQKAEALKVAVERGLRSPLG